MATLFGTTSCMDDHDAPNTDDYIVTSPTDIGEVNATILDVKAKYCQNSTGADYSRNSSNASDDRSPAYVNRLPTTGTAKRRIGMKTFDI